MRSRACAVGLSVVLAWSSFGSVAASAVESAVGSALGPAAAAPAAPARVSTRSEAESEAFFLSRINDLRSAHGLNTLAVDHELTDAARSWAESMASVDTLSHARDLSVGITSEWQVLGENVGVHSIHDLDGLFEAFVDSPAHFSNLVDARYNSVGVGVTFADDGKIWTTHRFMATRSATTTTPVTVPAPPAPPAPTAPATTTTRPAPAPSTTSAPATTTTRPSTTRPVPAPSTTSAPAAVPPTTPVPTTAPVAALSTASPSTTTPPTTAAVSSVPTTSALPPPTATSSSTEPAGSAPHSDTQLAELNPPAIGLDVELLAEILEHLPT